MPTLGGWEWVIILVIVLLLFGVGRVAELGRELGEGIRAFREGLREGEEMGTEDPEPDEDRTEE